MNLRNLARGQQCRIRIPGICTHNPEQTVLAHYRIGGLCGTGMKPHDLIGADACAACHDAVDGRRPHGVEEFRLADGTRCVLYDGYNAGNITCDWSRAEVEYGR